MARWTSRGEGQDDALLQDSKVPKCELKSGAEDRAGARLATTMA